jgi:hypothetical protein
VVSEEEEEEREPPASRQGEREISARKKRREELELRIGNTRAGYDWLRRVERIGKGDDRIVTAGQEEVEEERGNQG